MALNTQHYIYSIDTSCFYTDSEWAIQQKMTELYILRYQLDKEVEKLEKELKKCKNYDRENEINQALTNFKDYRTIYNKMISRLKQSLCEELDLTKEKDIVRELRDGSLIERRVVSIFSSSLTRALGLERNGLTENILVVQAYYFQVLEDIIKKGFMYNGEKYVCLTASAGQIRLKKTVFIKESIWKSIENKITCGLTLDKINSKGGMNVNKYLAYLALCNSATDVWQDFDIRKAIVVDDFETNVNSYVDVIDDKDYSITREMKEVPIPHMDGCGISLYKTFMVRLPYMKGLLVEFDYIDFIKENNCSSKVIDIYGKEYDVIEDDIQYIFTKSQFKMWKYFDSWEEYQDNFEKYGCEACYCNEEPDEIPDARINYQMLQTLFDMKTDEIEEICKSTNEEISLLGKDKDVIMNVLGVNGIGNKNYMQQALGIYEELINDPYNREILKDTKASLVKNGRAGKLKVDGKFTFISPDLYAFCEWLFMGIEKPQGLLKNGEVYCNLYPNSKKLDCLRSPHLYIEHAVRENLASGERAEQLARWFNTKCVYTSTHDVISKILQFDCDGDRSLVLADETIIKVAEREIKEYDIVPLYYNMQKAPAQIIDKSTIYNGLKSAYTSGNIGLYSNNISIILNSKDIVSNNKEDRIKALKAIKLLCMENNFVIDAAKTLYVPTRPNWAKELITSYTNHKLPHYFVYAKDKKDNQVEMINSSVVNKISKIIKSPRMVFSDLGLQKPDYRMLLSDWNFKSNKNQQDIIDLYDALNKSSRFYFIDREFDIKSLNDNLFLYDSIRKEFIEKFDNLNLVVNTLVETLYEKRKSSTKKLLWDCFGDILLDNLEKNVPKYTTNCQRCGVRIVKSGKVTKYCTKCGKEIDKQKAKERKKKKNK